MVLSGGTTPLPKSLHNFGGGKCTREMQGSVKHYDLAVIKCAAFSKTHSCCESHELQTWFSLFNVDIESIFYC